MTGFYMKCKTGLKWVNENDVSVNMLTHLFPMRLFSTPPHPTPPQKKQKKPRKSPGSLMFSGGRERVHWE